MAAGVHKKPMYRRDCLLRGLGQFADLRGRGGELGKKDRGGGFF